MNQENKSLAVRIREAEENKNQETPSVISTNVTYVKKLLGRQKRGVLTLENDIVQLTDGSNDVVFSCRLGDIEKISRTALQIKLQYGSSKYYIFFGDTKKYGYRGNYIDQLQNSAMLSESGLESWWKILKENTDAKDATVFSTPEQSIKDYDKLAKISLYVMLISFTGVALNYIIRFFI